MYCYPKRKNAAIAAIANNKTLDMQHSQLSRLMRLSWEIQRRRKTNRSKSLFAAWAIYLNEDITVYHLVQKHSHENTRSKPQTAHLTLFDY